MAVSPARFLFGGFLFRVQDDNEYICSYRYGQSQCMVTAVIGPHGDIYVEGEHEHTPQHLNEERQRLEMVRELKRQSLLTESTAEQIFQQVSNR